MQRRIVIFGAGGFGREVLQIIRDINQIKPTWLFEGFLVEKGYESRGMIQDCPVLEDMHWLVERPDVQVVIAIGSSAARQRIALSIRAICGNPFATLIHPRAWVGDHVVFGVGSVVCAGSLITTDVVVGEHVHVNIGSTIGHDAILKDYVTLNPGVNISGNVTVEEGAEIGTGSIVIPKSTVGEWSVIGAGATVTKPIPANATAVGSPAKVIKERQPGWHR